MSEEGEQEACRKLGIFSSLHLIQTTKSYKSLGRQFQEE